MKSTRQKVEPGSWPMPNLASASIAIAFVLTLSGWVSASEASDVAALRRENALLAARVRELEQQVRELQALLKPTATNANQPEIAHGQTGDVIGGKPVGGKSRFRFQNFTASGGGSTRLVGEIVNNTRLDYVTLIFQVAIYRRDGRLAGTRLIMLNQLSGLQAKAFDEEAIDIPFEKGSTYKFTFEGGVEAK